MLNRRLKIDGEGRRAARFFGLGRSQPQPTNFQVPSSRVPNKSVRRAALDSLCPTLTLCQLAQKVYVLCQFSKSLCLEDCHNKCKSDRVIQKSQKNGLQSRVHPGSQTNDLVTLGGAPNDLSRPRQGAWKRMDGETRNGPAMV